MDSFEQEQCGRFELRYKILTMLKWSRCEAHQARVLKQLQEVNNETFLNFDTNNCDYGLPDTLTWDPFYEGRVEAEIRSGNLRDVIALIGHHRGQFGHGSPRMGGLHGMETQGPRDALAELIKDIKRTVEPVLADAQLAKKMLLNERKDCQTHCVEFYEGWDNRAQRDLAGLESTREHLRIFEAMLVRAETEYQLSIMTRAERMADENRRFMEYMSQL